jgi:hypothetical protein
MKIVHWLVGTVCVTVVALSVRTTMAQVDPRMPEGPNRDLVVRICGECHALSNLYSTVGRTRDGWNEKIDDMILFGLKITPQERALILDYLAVALPR